MASKKTARKRKKASAVATVGRSTMALPAELEDEFAKYVNRDRASAGAAGWPFIKTEGSTPFMMLGEQKIGDANGALDAIVLGAVRINTHYEGDFQPGVVTPPTCFALADLAWDAAEIDAKLAPPAELPTKASDACQGCRFNAFGSGRGNSKACKNSVRLALIPADSKDFTKADGLLLNVPPASMKLWSSYVQPWASIGRPIFSVLTQIEKMPAQRGSGFTLHFTPMGPIDDVESLRELAARVSSDAEAALTQPPMTGEASTSS
ncbi:unnamed protein product, partial [marine sediment metagenome]